MFKKNLVYSLYLQISVPEVHRIDTGAIYTNVKIEQLQKWVPQINWLGYFNNLLHPQKLNSSEEIVSYSTPYFLKLGKIIDSVDKRYDFTCAMYIEETLDLYICNGTAFQFYSIIYYRVIYNYVIWKYMLDLMPHLPSKFQKARSKFRAVLLGVLIDR